MKKKVTIRDIAKKAGVSDATVSLSFKENSRISEKTTKKILQIAKELNYFPNISARNLRYGHSKTIGFIVTDITDPFYARMIRCAEKISEQSGYNIIFADSNWDTQKELKIVSNMIGSQVQGIIICFCERTEDTYNLLKTFNLPHITVDTFPGFYKGPYIANDVYRAGYIAAEHLIQIGCKRLAYFDATKEMNFFSSFKSLQRGFKSCVNKNSEKIIDHTTIHSDLTFMGGKEGFEKLFTSGKKYDGFFCVNDLCAYGVIEKAEDKGLKVGKDIAVMGIDNLETSEFSRISLTSINQPYEKMIEHATQNLIDQIEGKAAKIIKKKVKPNLIIRESTSSL